VSRTKLIYIVGCFALYALMMWAFAGWVAEPFSEWFGDWYVRATDSWPYATQMAGIALIPVICYALAYLFYRRDYRKGIVQAPTFWRYLRGR
jgi:hypothetical protein